MNASTSTNTPNNGSLGSANIDLSPTRRVSARTIGLLAAAAAAGSLAFAAAASASEPRADDRSTGQLQTSTVERPVDRGIADPVATDITLDSGSGGWSDDSFDCPACGMG